MKQKLAVLFFVPFLPALAAGPTGPPTETSKRLAETAMTVQAIMRVSERSIPQTLLDRSQCVVIVPSLKKGALIIGAKWGRGFVTCRKSQAGWGAPAAVRVEGGSFGLQAGGSSTDVVMLVMNERGAQRLMRSKVTLGGDASVAAGPVGRSATAETDAMMTAEILTWSRSRGLFAGVSLQGATLRSDLDVNKELYGQPWTAKEVIFSGLEPHPDAVPLINLLNKFSSRRTN